MKRHVSLPQIEERLEIISVEQHALARERAILTTAARRLRLGEDERVVQAMIEASEPQIIA
jgi:hypothetical protein